MLTIVTYGELERLYRNRKLLKSESFNFLTSRTQNFLGAVYRELFNKSMARLIHLRSINGQKITTADRGLLEDVNGDILAYLPLLEEEQILILSKPEKEVIEFSDKTLDEIENAIYLKDEEAEFCKNLLLQGVTKKEECTYIIQNSLALENVVSVIYSEDLEEKVELLKRESKARDVLYKTTSLFNT